MLKKDYQNKVPPVHFPKPVELGDLVEIPAGTFLVLSQPHPRIVSTDKTITGIATKVSPDNGKTGLVKVYTEMGILSLYESSIFVISR